MNWLSRHTWKIILLMVFMLMLLVIGLLGANTWSSTSYSRTCTKCLKEWPYREKRFLGICYSSTEHKKGTAHRVNFSEEAYERLFGHTCEHIFRKGGRCIYSLGGVRCGETNEGSLCGRRKRAVMTTYLAEQRLHDASLAIETFALIDNLAPPEVIPLHSSDADSTLLLLDSYLSKAASLDDWRRVLNAARDGFKDTAMLRQTPPG